MQQNNTACIVSLQFRDRPACLSHGKILQHHHLLNCHESVLPLLRFGSRPKAPPIVSPISQALEDANQDRAED
jgi:hypothetical protein